MNKRQSIKVLRRIVMGSILTLGYSACSPSHPDVADSATIKEAWLRHVSLVYDCLTFHSTRWK